MSTVMGLLKKAQRHKPFWNQQKLKLRHNIHPRTKKPRRPRYIGRIKELHV